MGAIRRFKRSIDKAQGKAKIPLWRARGLAALFAKQNYEKTKLDNVARPGFMNLLRGLLGRRVIS